MELFQSQVASPSQVAACLGEPLRAVAYHVRCLEHAGFIELVERTRRHGATEHYYTALRGPTISDDEWGALSLSQRRIVIAGGLRRLGPRLAAAASYGGFQHKGAHIEVMPMRLGSEEWVRAAKELGQAFAQIEQLANAAKLRAYHEGVRAAAHALVALMLFKSPGSHDRNGGTVATLDSIDLMDPKMVAATSHPLRSEMFRLLRERRASPSELARVLQAPVGNTSYHVRRLAEMGLVKLVDQRERGGSIEHYYEATVAPTIVAAHWQGLITDSHAASAAGLLVAAARGGGFDADGIHFTRTPFPIDDQAWGVTAEILKDARASLRRVDSAARRDQRERALDDAHAVTMLFEGRRRAP
jgi:DNA-binding transcriptional ArsR family regulator